jgi:protein SCO1/2
VISKRQRDTQRVGDGRRAFLAALLAPTFAAAGQPKLPVIGPAPAFALIDQAGRPVSLADLRGKVLAISFVFTTCSDSCPIVTAKMVDIKRRLGSDFGPRVHFVSISVDPLSDTPERLRAYAAKFNADVPGWSFLTGTPAQIDHVVRRFGAYARRADNGGVDHLNLTSLIDARGRLRVQYLGYRFQEGEMLADLQALLGE